MSLGAGDLMEALCELHDRFGCERLSASFRLADGVLMTVALDADSNLAITRVETTHDDGDDALRRFTVERRRRKG